MSTPLTLLEQTNARLRSEIAHLQKKLDDKSTNLRDRAIVWARSDFPSLDNFGEDSVKQPHKQDQILARADKYYEHLIKDQFASTLPTRGVALRVLHVLNEERERLTDDNPPIDFTDPAAVADWYEGILYRIRTAVTTTPPQNQTPKTEEK